MSIRKEIEDTSKYDRYIAAILTKIGRNRVESAKLFRDLMRLAIEFGDEDLQGAVKQYARETQKADKMMLHIIDKLKKRRGNA